MPQLKTHWGKSARIAEQLRDRIVRNELKPGSRLPNRAQLEEEFGTTPSTMQKAIRELQQDNLVVARGRNGTFVSERLPHRHRIGIVFPTDPANLVSWARMYAAIDEEARRLVHEGSFELAMYYGTEEADSAGRLSLLDDIANHRLAGLFIMGMALDYFEGTSVLDHPFLRVVAVTSHGRRGVTQVQLGPFLPPAIDAAQAAGRSRIAMVYSPIAKSLPGALKVALEARGLAYQANWCLPAWTGTPEAARAAAYLLLRQPLEERPDAIIVNDDYLAEPVTQGVLDAGVRAPEDVSVIVQCNFPHLPPTVTPICRLGVDLPSLLASTLTALLGPDDLPESMVAPIVGEAELLVQHADATTLFPISSPYI